MLSLSDARRAVRAAEEKARELGHAVNIAVVDSTGHLTAQVRMDGACRACIDAAANKAHTARCFDMATSHLGDLAREDNGVHGIGSLGRRTVLTAGGIPLRLNGEICGGIGVCGASPREDELIAKAAANALANTYANGHYDEFRRRSFEQNNPATSQIARLGQRKVPNQMSQAHLQ